MTNEDKTISKKGSPTAVLLESANKEFEIEDARGRKIIIKRPNVLTSHYFATLFKPECALNQSFMMAMGSLMFVKSIDGEEIKPFRNETDVQVLLQTLDNDGKDAVDKCCFKEFIEPSMTEAGFETAVKK